MHSTAVTTWKWCSGSHLSLQAPCTPPTFFVLINWGWAQISSIQNLEVFSSLVKCIVTGSTCTGFFPAAENLLIAVRGVSYPHVTQLVGGIYAQSTWIIVIFMQLNNSISFSCFSIREKLYMNHLKLNIVNRSGRISFCMNRYFEVTLTWSKWC